MKLLESGVDYDKLPEMWTIWILPYDPFGLDLRIYSVKNIVEENPKIEYNDGIRKLFLYTKGNMGGSKTLRDLLAYIQNTTKENAVDEDLKKLHTNVERLKSNKQIGVKYMHMQEVIKYAVKEEVEEIVKQKMKEFELKTETIRQEVEAMKQDADVAKQEADVAKQEADVAKQEADVAKQEADVAKQEADVAKKTLKLIQILLEAGRYEDIKSATQDEKYRNQIIKELGID